MNHPVFRLILSGLLIFFILSPLEAQIFYSRDGKISFYSDAPLEKIEAHNQNASSVISLEDGRIEFAVLIKAFQFKKALMQEHFNENYLESDKFPKATFQGNFNEFTLEDLSENDEFEVDISGTLTIHGQSKPVDVVGVFVLTDNMISANSLFEISVADYGIKIPKIVRENIAKEVQIEVSVDYIPMASE